MLKLADARRIIDAAEKKAIEIGQPMNIAVVDEGANLISHIRMDNAWIGSINIAINKAFTARAFNISTKELAENSQPGDQFYGIHVSNHDRVMIFAGGIPLKKDGKVVGAVGVSGGDGKQDQAVAEAGAAAAGRRAVAPLHQVGLSCAARPVPLRVHEGTRLEHLPEVRLRQVEQLVAPARQQRAHRVEREPLRLRRGDGRGDRQLLPLGDDVHQRGPVVREGLAQGGVELAGVLDPHAVQSYRAGDLGETGVVEIRAEGDDPVSLHLQLHKGQGAVVQDDDLDRQPLLAEREELAQQRRQPAVAGEAHHLASRVRRLHADRLGQRVGH